MTAGGKKYINALKMSSTASSVKANKMPADKKTAPKTAAAPAPAPAAAPKAAPAKKAVAKKETPAKAEVVVPTVAATTAPVIASISSEVLLATLTEQLKALSTEFTAKVRDAVKATQEAAKAAKKEARDSKKKRKINPADMTPEQKAAWEARRAKQRLPRPASRSPPSSAPSWASPRGPSAPRLRSPSTSPST
jgi:transcription-repair coupling factor (superfamily II helicase)